MGKSCFFIGHREATDTILPEVEETIRRHIIENGVTQFIVGNHGGFDQIAARAVINVKKTYSHVSLSCILSYHPAERPIEKPVGFDETFYPPGMERVPRRLAIARANRYIVDHVNYLIAYAWHPGSNAFRVLEYALKREKRGFIKVTVLKKPGPVESEP